MNVSNTVMHVMEHVSRYDRVPAVNRVTSEKIRHESIWLERLREQGFYYRHAKLPDLSYRSVYETLYNKDFDANLAYLSACKRDDIATVTYLSHYISKDLHASCLKETTSEAVINLVAPSVSNDRDQVLLSSLNNVEKLRTLLNYYSPRRIIPTVLTTAKLEVQVAVVHKLTLSEVRPFLDLIEYQQIGEIIEAKGYSFNINRSIDLNLVSSTKKWIDNQPTVDAVTGAIKHAISVGSRRKRNEEVLRALFSLANTKYLANTMQYCATNGLEAICTVLAEMNVATDSVITQCIRDNRVGVCRGLAKYANSKHLNLASRLGRVEIYNILAASLRSR